MSNISTFNRKGTSSLLTRNVPDPEKVEKIIRKKERTSMLNRDQIRELNDSISKISEKLKEKRTGEKSLRVSTSRTISHVKALEVDGRKRPPDRYGDVRSYSRMDMDVWRYDQLREWFNTYAPAQDVTYDFKPSQTGYTVKIDD